ncbi:MAG: ISAs1 family transposase [Permianibacter sp.]
MAGSLHESIDSRHVRMERCRCWAFDHLSSLPQPERWAGLRRFAVLESERHPDGNVSKERRCYIASVAADAGRVAYAVRRHWEIENGFRLLDVTFDEDDSRILCGNGAEHFAALRALAVSLLKRESTTISIHKKRIRAALNDNFHLQVLESVRGKMRLPCLHYEVMVEMNGFHLGSGGCINQHSPAAAIAAISSWQLA